MGERSRRGRGGPAPTPTPAREADGGRGRARRRVSGFLGPGIRRKLRPEGCNTRGEVVRRALRRAAPPRATFPTGPSRPSRSRSRRTATVEVRPAAAGRRPGGGPPPTPPPAPPARHHHTTPRARRRSAGRGEEEGNDARVEGSGGTGSGKDPPGPPARPDARRRVESSGRTARTPPVYLLTVSRPLELSLQSSFQLSLTVLVDYRSRAGI